SYLTHLRVAEGRWGGQIGPLLDEPPPGHQGVPLGVTDARDPPNPVVCNVRCAGDACCPKALHERLPDPTNLRCRESRPVEGVATVNRPRLLDQPIDFGLLLRYESRPLQGELA